MSYKVIAPLVLAKDPEGKTHHRYEGEVIQWLSPEQAQHFLGLDLVVEVGKAPAAVAEPAPAGGGDAPEKPKRTAPKAAWAEFAGLSEEETEAMTKAEIIEQFG